MLWTVWDSGDKFTNIKLLKAFSRDRKLSEPKIRSKNIYHKFGFRFDFQSQEWTLVHMSIRIFPGHFDILSGPIMSSVFLLSFLVANTHLILFILLFFLVYQPVAKEL